MFGMSSEEFWEQSPQLYWAYRIFYLKKLNVDNENKRYSCWLQGNLNQIALSNAIYNCFSAKDGTTKEFPSFKDLFEVEEKLTKKEKENKTNLIVQEEWNSWARF